MNVEGSQLPERLGVVGAVKGNQTANKLTWCSRVSHGVMLGESAQRDWTPSPVVEDPERFHKAVECEHGQKGWRRC